MLRSGEVSDCRVQGVVWFGCPPLSDEWCRFASLLYESPGRPRRGFEWSESIRGETMPSRCQLAPYSLSFNSHLLPHPLSGPPHPHYPREGTTDRSQLVPKASRDVSVIIKMALWVPNTSLVMCVCILLHKNICRNTHTTWQYEATSFLT